MFLWWGFKYWHMLHWFLILGIPICAWSRTLPCVLCLIENLASFGEEHQYDLPGNYPLLSLLIKQWFYYYYLFVVWDRWQRRSLLYWTRCSLGHGRSPWMVNTLVIILSSKYPYFCARPGPTLTSQFKCEVVINPLFVHVSWGQKDPREGNTVKIVLFKLTFVVVLILKWCFKIQCGLAPHQWVWSCSPIQTRAPGTRSSLHGSYMHVPGVVHTCGMMLCLGLHGPRSHAAPSACPEQCSAWGKMRIKEDFFPTFENFKENVLNLVLMIPVSVQSIHKDLKSAHWSEMVFGKSDLIPRAKWSLPTEIRKTQSPQQILIWRMHKMFKRAEVSFTFLPLIWDFLPY